VSNKLSEFVQIPGTVSEAVKPCNVQTQTGLEVRSTLGTSAASAEMAHCLTTRNHDIMKELEKHTVLGKINDYKDRCVQHIRRVDRFRLPYDTVKYQPAGQRPERATGPRSRAHDDDDDDDDLLSEHFQLPAAHLSPTLRLCVHCSGSPSCATPCVLFP
jgi:hypothetical protein